MAAQAAPARRSNRSSLGRASELLPSRQRSQLRAAGEVLALALVTQRVLQLEALGQPPTAVVSLVRAETAERAAMHTMALASAAAAPVAVPPSLQVAHRAASARCPDPHATALYHLRHRISHPLAGALGLAPAAAVSLARALQVAAALLAVAVAGMRMCSLAICSTCSSSRRL